MTLRVKLEKQPQVIFASALNTVDTYILSRRFKISLYSNPSCQCFLKSSLLVFNKVLQVVKFSLKEFTFALQAEERKQFRNTLEDKDNSKLLTDLILILQLNKTLTSHAGE